MNNTLTNAKFEFREQIKFYRGKVRDVYYLKNDYIAMVVSDRISAFDHVMPRGIPYKGQILNQIAIEMMNQTSEHVPNWFVNSPDPNVSIGHLCEPFKVEMVIRAYLAGHAFREYKKGKRLICGVKLPDGLKENDILPDLIITPTTKAEIGNHDEDISREDIIKKGIVSDHDYIILEKYTRKLFSIGQKIANERGLILVDTKYEFGKKKDGTVVLISDIVGGKGKIVLVRHDNQLITIYGRLTNITVIKGQTLLQGETIGDVIGDPETNKGLMHFEVRKGMKSIDPETMIR